MMFFNSITERGKRTKTGDGKRALDGHGVLTEKSGLRPLGLQRDLRA